MYSFSSTVRYSESDEHGLLSIPALINYLQDCSTFHTESVGHGIEHLAKNHFAWFITAWLIEIDRLPRYTEPIVVRTWCYAMTATSAGRCFTMETADGEILVRADSQWVAFDTELGRPVRIPASEHVLIAEEPRIEMEPLQRKLAVTGDGVAKSPITVNEQHLDTNHHVNNGQYVAMATALVAAEDDSFAPRRLQVQYKNAARLGDCMLPVLYKEAGGYAVDLVDENGKRFAAIRLQK